MAGIAAMLLVLLPMRPAFGDIRWYFQPERAFAAARAANKPVMLDLVDQDRDTFDWYDSFLLRDGRVVDSAKNDVVPLRLSVDDLGKPFYTRYQVPTAPAILFMAPDGRPLWRVVGRVSADIFLGQMRQAVRLMPDLDRYLRVATAGKGSIEELAGAAGVSVAMGREVEAQALLDKAGWQRRTLDPLVSEAVLSLADTLRVSGRVQQALPLFNAVAQQKASEQVAHALYGIAVCQWRNGKPREAFATFNRVASMGDLAGDYRFISRRLLGRFSMMPVANPVFLH